MTKSAWLLGVLMPMAIIVIILAADRLEGPKTAYVGVLAVVPVFAAVFGTPVSTALVGVLTVAAGFTYGLFAEDGDAPAQAVRLVIIAIMTGLAIAAARLREAQERRLADALRQAARATSLETLAETDQLTQIPNRRGVLARANAMAQPGERTVALMDLDNLKAVNDEHGHLVGDAYLQAVAGRLSGAVSKTDAVGRWGGDEFLMVLDQPVDRAHEIVERIHRAVVAHPVATDDVSLTVSASIGIARWSPGEALDETLVRADSALYEAKAAGRNMIVSEAE